jgi:hypothetical protein
VAKGPSIAGLSDKLVVDDGFLGKHREATSQVIEAHRKLTCNYLSMKPKMLPLPRFGGEGTVIEPFSR